MNENQKTVLGFLVMGIILGVGGTIGIQLMLVFLTNDKDNLDTSEIPLGKYCDEVEAGYQGGCMQRPEKTIDPDISDKVVGIKETNSTQPITRTTNSTYPDISNQMEGLSLPIYITLLEQYNDPSEYNETIVKSSHKVILSVLPDYEDFIGEVTLVFDNMTFTTYRNEKTNYRVGEVVLVETVKRESECVVKTAYLSNGDEINTTLYKLQKPEGFEPKIKSYCGDAQFTKVTKIYDSTSQTNMNGED